MSDYDTEAASHGGVRFPAITVKLVGTDGNAFFILARVKRAMIQHGISESVIEQFWYEATQGDYDHLLQTVMKWVTVE